MTRVMIIVPTLDTKMIKTDSELVARSPPRQGHEHIAVLLLPYSCYGIDVSYQFPNTSGISMEDDGIEVPIQVP